MTATPTILAREGLPRSHPSGGGPPHGMTPQTPDTVSHRHDQAVEGASLTDGVDPLWRARAAAHLADIQTKPRRGTVERRLADKKRRLRTKRLRRNEPRNEED